MANVFEGNFKATSNEKIGIVVSKFNEFVTGKLLDGAIQTLIKNGVEANNIDVLKVPGAFELPTAASSMLSTKKYNAVICLGAVIRGETPHFDYICSSISNQIARLGVKSKLPVIFGVITTDTIDQAMDRSGGSVGNKGSEAAIAALEMIDVLRQIKTEDIELAN